MHLTIPSVFTVTHLLDARTVTLTLNPNIFGAWELSWITSAHSVQFLGIQGVGCTSPIFL